MDDLISRQAAIDALEKLARDKFNLSDDYEHYIKALTDAGDILQELSGIQPEIIRCKDCYWWTNQEDSLQGRCDRYGMYPTGYWYCAAARERREE